MFWIVVLQKTFESPLNCKEDKPVNPKGNQLRIFIGGTDTEAETPILWPPDAKNWLTGKDPDAGKDWRQEEKGMTEDELVGWHHWLNGHEFEQTPGDGERQGSLACWNPWGHKELDMTGWLNYNRIVTEQISSLSWFFSNPSKLKLINFFYEFCIICTETFEDVGMSRDLGWEGADITNRLISTRHFKKWELCHTQNHNNDRKLFFKQ